MAILVVSIVGYIGFSFGGWIGVLVALFVCGLL